MLQELLNGWVKIMIRRYFVGNCHAADAIPRGAEPRERRSPERPFLRFKGHVQCPDESLPQDVSVAPSLVALHAPLRSAQTNELRLAPTVGCQPARILLYHYSFINRDGLRVGINC